MPVGYAKSIDQVPKGAIIIASPEEAYERHRTLIRAWKPQRDVFALKYGGLFISAAATTTAVFMFTPLRRSLKLQGYNASSIFLAGLLPAPNVIYYQFEKLIETPLVIADKYMCPACICTRALALQFAVGICLPTVSMAVLNYIVF
ncbi:uncharacterized protein [Prorops nasuta]|uniref:uncharacterized protein isoform X2 n=1 Tax=Prorops nasuta TaxID=863751 RepID=UPI0034CF1C3E